MEKTDIWQKELLNMTWEEYCRAGTDTMYFYDGKTFIEISEGDGSNLSYEDEEMGYVDYWYAEVYTEEAGNCGGGLLLVKEAIQEENRSIGEIIEFLKDNADAFDEVSPEVLDHIVSVKEGKALDEKFTRIENELIAGRLAESRKDTNDRDEHEL